MLPTSAMFENGQMDTLLDDDVREILQWVLLSDVFRLSRASLGANHAVASAIDPCTAQGNTWWIALLHRDVQHKQIGKNVSAKQLNRLMSNDRMSGAEKYVLLMPNVLDCLRFAVHAQSAEMLKYIAEKTTITLQSNFLSTRSDVRVTPEELEQIIDIVNQRHLSGEILWRIAVQGLVIPVTSLLRLGRVDLAAQLVSLSTHHYYLLPLALRLADDYEKHKNPMMLELFRRTVTHRSFKASEAVRRIANSGSTEAMAILLSTE